VALERNHIAAHHEFTDGEGPVPQVEGMVLCQRPEQDEP